MSAALFNIITYPIIFLMGVFLNRIFESRSRLITYYGHIGAGKVRINSVSIDINTHSIVIRNVGRKPALNVRVGHNINDLGSMVAVYPPAEHTIHPIEDAGEEIRFGRLLPKQSIVITYVYSSPLNYSLVNTYVVSDEGMAKRVNVLLNQQLPNWLHAVLWVFLFVGFITITYLLYEYVRPFLYTFFK